MTAGVRVKHRFTILGSKGSLGAGTLDVIRQLGGRERFDIRALTGSDSAAMFNNGPRDDQS